MYASPAPTEAPSRSPAKGVAHYLIRVTGRAAHAGLEPQLGINAGVELAHQILALDMIADHDQDTTVTPTRGRAGATANTVPETAELHVDVRAWTAGEMDRVHRALLGLRPVTPGAELDVSVLATRSPFEHTASAKLLEHAQTAAADLGLPPA